MQRNRRIIDLSEMEQLVEGAFVELAMNKINGQLWSDLDKLNSEISVVVKGFLAYNLAIMRMRPANKAGLSIHKAAFKIKGDALAGKRLGKAI